MGELTMSETILNVLIIIFSALVMILDLSLLIAVFRLQKTNSLVKTLSVQLLLSIFFYSLSFALTSFLEFKVNINCEFFNVEACFSGSPMVLSLLSITLNSYLILTNNYTFHRKKQMVLVLLILMTWLPSVGFVVLYLIYRSKTQMKEGTCFLNDKSYLKAVSVPQISIEVISIIICLILLFKVCTLKVQNDKGLQISKKKTITKIVSYIIMIICGTLLKTFMFYIVTDLTIQNYLRITSCVYFLILNYVFLWNKQLKDSLLSTFCCRNNEETQETMMKNNQKELAFQYDVAEDISQHNSDEEEPTDN